MCSIHHPPPGPQCPQRSTHSRSDIGLILVEKNGSVVHSFDSVTHPPGHVPVRDALFLLRALSAVSLGRNCQSEAALYRRALIQPGQFRGATLGGLLEHQPSLPPTVYWWITLKKVGGGEAEQGQRRRRRYGVFEGAPAFLSACLTSLSLFWLSQQEQLQCCCPADLYVWPCQRWFPSCCR